MDLETLRRLPPDKRFNYRDMRAVAGLNPGLPDPTRLRDAIAKYCFPDIFDALRPLPIAQQEKLAIQTLGPENLNFPNGVRVAKELIRINNIQWFQPKEDPDIAFLKEKKSQILNRLNLKDSPLHLIRNNWDAACNAYHAVDNAVRDAVATAVRNTAQVASYEAWNAVWSAADGAVWDEADDDADDDAAYAATGCVTWIMVEDLMLPGKNPFQPEIDIFEQGGWPIGVSQGKFVVFWPEVKVA